MCRKLVIKIDKEELPLAYCWLHYNSSPRLFGKLFSYELDIPVAKIEKLYPLFKQDGFEDKFEDYVANFTKGLRSFNKFDSHFFYCCLDEICRDLWAVEKVDLFQWVINTVESCALSKEVIKIFGQCTKFIPAG